jgi:hypothetical protein
MACETASGIREADNASKPGGQEQHCEGMNPMSAAGTLTTSRTGHATSGAGSGTPTPKNRIGA